jgi:hypothetical protein
VNQRQKSIDKVVKALEEKGLTPEEAYQLSYETEHGTVAPGDGPSVGQDGNLRTPTGQILFSNPVGPALKFGADVFRGSPVLSGAAGGAAIGAYSDDENPWRGAAYGAAAGASVGGMAGALLRPRSIHLSLPPIAAAALDKASKGIDFDGSIRKAVTQAAGVSGASVSSIIGNRFWQLADQVGNAYGIIERLGRTVDAPPTRNARDVLNYVKSTDHTVGRFRSEGTIDPITRQVTGPSYDSIFEPFGNDTDALTKFLGYAKSLRDVGRVARMGLDAMGGDQAAHQAAVEAVRAGDQVPLFKDAAAKMQRFVKGIADYAEGSGLWTAAQRAEIEASDSFYLPYRRVLAPAIIPGTAGTGGGGIFNVTDGIRRFRGSAEAIDNPATTLAEYAQNIIRRSDRYRAGVAIIDNVEALGPEGLAILSPLPDGGGPLAARKAQAAAMAESWKQVGMSTEAGAALLDAFDTQISKHNPVIWRNGADGRREAFQMNAPGLLRAAEAMNPEYLNEWLRLALTPIKGVKRLFTATTTALNPRFAGATNPLRDAVEVFAKSEAAITPAHLARGYAESLAYALGLPANVAKEAIDAGLGGTSMFFRDGNPAAMSRQAAPISVAGKARNVLAGAGAPVRFAEKAGEASDLGPRLAEYMATIEKYGDKVASGEWTPADLRLRAATNARGVTIDFANRPGNKLLRGFADYIPFFGVGLQAPVSLANAVSRSPARVMAVMGAVGGASILAWAKLNSLPPEHQAAVRDRPATERAAFLLVPIDDRGNVARFPLGAEMGLVHAAVTAALDTYMAHDPHGAQLLAEAATRALPPGVGDFIAGDRYLPIPLVQQSGEIDKNKTHYGDRPIVPRRLQELAPEERRLDTTSPTFDLLAAGVRGLGGKERREFSPLQAEHMTRGVLSNATPLVTAVTDPIAERLVDRGGPAQRVPVPAIQHPLNPMSAVIGKNPPGGTQAEQDYYAVHDLMDEAHNTVVDRMKANDRASIPRLQKYAPYLQPVPTETIKAADKALKAIKARETAVTAAFRDGHMDGETARDSLDQFRYTRQEVYRRATTILRQTGVLK